MKALASIFILCICFGVVAQSTETEATTTTAAKITFEESSFAFGDITQGDQISHTFAYENTGNEPLIITQVKTTCGCTATNWSREPLAPGESSEIKVNFNSRGKIGMQNKVVTIVSNASNNPERIKITTNVLQKPVDQ